MGDWLRDSQYNWFISPHVDTRRLNFATWFKGLDLLQTFFFFLVCLVHVDIKNKQTNRTKNSSVRRYCRLGIKSDTHFALLWWLKSHSVCAVSQNSSSVFSYPQFLLPCVWCQLRRVWERRRFPPVRPRSYLTSHLWHVRLLDTWGGSRSVTEIAACMCMFKKKKKRGWIFTHQNMYTLG